MRGPTRLLATVLFASSSVLACGDEEVTGTTDTEDVAATETTIDLDSVITFDTTTSTSTSTEPTDTTSTSTSPTDTSVDPDTGPTCDSDPKPFFCPCENNVQCESGYCISVDEETVARRCSRTCLEDCPQGWECRSASSGGDPVFICQPPIDTLCRPCTIDSDCEAIQAMCVTFADGKFCGRDCQNDPNSCPATYECDNIDNDLGQTLGYQCVPTSGSCQCPVGTDYDNDPANCGYCKNACSFFGGVPGCATGECYLKDCQGGYVDLDEVDGTGCEYECDKTSEEDWPDATCTGSDCDQDCDGIDGEWRRAIFVQAGPTNGNGSPQNPMNTIQGAIDAAGGDKDHVYVAAGSYNEQVTLKVGVSVFGGYSNDGRWVRKLSQYTSTITNASGTTSVRVVIADGIDGARTVFDGFTVTAGANANPGGSSYAIWVRNSTGSLEIANVSAVGGNGGKGQDGGAGQTGADGVRGTDATEAPDSDDECNEESLYGSQGGGAGPNPCSRGTSAAGGKGGASGCRDDSAFDDVTVSARKGADSPGGAAGGPAPGVGANGNRGNDGSSPPTGTDGSGGTAGGFVDASGFWRGYAGTDGADGANGVGGGGGSGGGGACCTTIGLGKWGGGGGGGGSGGCGGGKGTAGGAGGASFGIFLQNASPMLVNSQFGHKSGGSGGNGGIAGGGGVGKGGGGGIAGFDGAGNGAGGGAGGNGARGGHGGGGAGGVAYGLYLSGSSDPTCSNLGFSPAGSGGTGGLGGVGGDQTGNRGADGAFGERNKSSPMCP